MPSRSAIALTLRVRRVMRQLWPQTPAREIAPLIGARTVAQVARTARRLGLESRHRGRPRFDGEPCQLRVPSPPARSSGRENPDPRAEGAMFRCPVCQGRSATAVHPECSGILVRLEADPRFREAAMAAAKSGQVVNPKRQAKKALRRKLGKNGRPLSSRQWVKLRKQLARAARKES